MGKVSEKKVTINKATGRNVTYRIPFSDKYKAFGDRTLVNGIRGIGDFNDGQWQGFEGTNMDVIIDLGTETAITLIATSFLASVGRWVFLPESVEFMVSSDGNDFTILNEIATKIKAEEQEDR